MEQKVTHSDSIYKPGNSNSDNPKVKKIIFGKDVPTHSEIVEIYMDEVIKRAKGNRVIISQLSGLKSKDFSLLMKKINKKKKNLMTGKSDG